MDKKRLCKSNDKMILGVCSGIADFLNVDHTVIRLCAVLLTILGILPGILVYIIFAIYAQLEPVKTHIQQCMTIFIREVPLRLCFDW